MSAGVTVKLKFNGESVDSFTERCFFFASNVTSNSVRLTLLLAALHHYPISTYRDGLVERISSEHPFLVKRIKNVYSRLPDDETIEYIFKTLDNFKQDIHISSADRITIAEFTKLYKEKIL